MAIETKKIKLINTYSFKPNEDPIVVVNPTPTTLPNTPVQQYVEDSLNITDKTIYIPCYDKNAYYAIQEGTIYLIETDDYDEVIYYENLKMNFLKTEVMSDQEPIPFSYLEVPLLPFEYDIDDPYYPIPTVFLNEESGNYRVPDNPIPLSDNYFSTLICMTPVKTLTYADVTEREEGWVNVLFTPGPDFTWPDDADQEIMERSGLVPGDGKAYIMPFCCDDYYMRWMECIKVSDDFSARVVK